MTTDQPISSRGEAARDFCAQLGRSDGERFVASISAGLDTLRLLMMDRVSTDPNFQFGADSMFMPSSIAKGHAAATVEVELYQAVESAQSASAGQHLPPDREKWFLHWLTGLRLTGRTAEPAVIQRLAVYHAKPADGRRMAFETAVERVLPTASRAPLVLYRVFPLAIAVATSLAFEDSVAADQVRHAQLELLPSLADCQACRARILENGEKCRQCGNPLWKFDWLTAE